MWSSRLFWKIFAVYIGLSLALATGVLYVVNASQRYELKHQTEQRLYETAIILRSHIRDCLIGDAPAGDLSDQQAQLQSLVQRLADQTQLRITIVDSSGVVQADSERSPRLMLDHGNRPELIEAADETMGTATRLSPTLRVEMLYVALKTELDDGSHAFVRVAARMDAISERMANTRRYLLTFTLLFGLLTTVITYLLIGRIIHPLALLTRNVQAISDGKSQELARVHSSDEVGTLSAAFNQMQSELATRFGQLRERNEQLSTVLGNLLEGIIAVDANENVVMANDASRRMLSMPEAVGRPLLELTRCRPLHDAVRKCLSTGATVKTEFVSEGAVRRDLALRATRLPGYPSPGVLVVLHDISELRRLESLRHQFVANVSHELKTPLASIKAYAETLRNGAIRDEENNLIFVNRIEEQAERLHQLIVDMLHIARVEAGEEAFDITQVAVQNVVDASVRMSAQSAKQKNIRLLVEPPPERVVVVADENGLRTVLDNLLSNAVKYTPEDGKVTVRWSVEDQQCILEVQDTGIGIAPEHQKRIFERFYRVDEARSRDLGGTGLGLSIVKHLCLSFNGSVELQSVWGEGTTFRVSLPVAAD
ncbi:sensor histidine kinase [Allorhodopirellula solitaria]|uniref:histidine kinase n=1 Tax=Allorhodopirellula solitaria TaxID=2527987 RepID=A0A5C5YE13_9BACT|nr:sensor histidine kinase [Allorhodopirellula solitaria]TWT73179.1 Sensor histidine kinase YycG [Allorhodopirellula solitaria]